ncbi:MAG: hypothetical protein HN909_07280 [Phycisphaerales bacterium]|nr:hypothetical protein [Phycisphaerales bacterium]
MDIDIDTVISDSLKEIETERVSSISSRKGREDFFWDVAARLHTPRLYEKPGDPKYKPFCIGDEPVARIPYSANQKLRLAKMLAKAGRFNSTYVTTYSSNRNFLRRNKDDARQRINPNINYLKNLRDADGNLVYPNEKALDALDIDRLIVREGLYPQLVEAITNPDMKPTSKAVEIAEKKAKHLVANLWAYCDGMKPEKDYLFMGVYGVVPRPVIADVYCWHNKNTAPTGQDNSFRACAIEIFNPTDAPVNLSEYELKDVPLSGTIDPQKRKVFYSYHAGNEVAPNRDEAKKTLQLSGAPIPSTWVELPDLDFSAGVTFRLMKGDVPIDAFKTSAFDKYKPIASGNYGPKSIKRDDSWDDPETYDRFEGRERYNVAMWVTSGVNKLGKPNLVGHSPMPLTVPANGKPICVEGFNIVKKRKVTKDGLDYLVCPSVGELFHLFAIGPVQGGKSLPERLATESMYNNKRVSIPIRRSDHRGKAVPAYDAHRGSLPYCVGGPWPCVLGEFVDVVPPDPTRNISHIDGKPVYAVQYGKINVNTASRTVLKALPYPHGSFYFGVKGATGGAYPTRLGRLTLDDARNIGGKIKDRVIDLPALKTPGHVMADVRDKINFMINKSNATEQCIGYVHAYASFGRIIDVLTVNSDSFAVTLKIATTKDNSTPTANGKNVMGEWSYLAVIDRSNCMNNEDVPQIMLFMPFK